MDYRAARCSEAVHWPGTGRMSGFPERVVARRVVALRRGWQTAPMTTARPTWIIVVRDLSHIMDEAEATVCVVLDAEAGLIRGLSLADDPRDACAGAVETALTEPAADLPPAQPGGVICVDERTSRLATPHLTRHGIHKRPTVASSPAAEDVVDSMVGHLSGRAQPAEFPAPDDWTILFRALHRYASAEPWRRWGDTELFDLVLVMDGAPSEYVVGVLGQAGIQRGLNLYPGSAAPKVRDDWVPGEPPPFPAGTLLVWLDPPAEVQPEFVGKAARYGWPPDASVFPVPLAFGATGPVDIDRHAARVLTLATTAMVAHLDEGADPTEGRVELAEGEGGAFTVRPRRTSELDESGRPGRPREPALDLPDFLTGVDPTELLDELRRAGMPTELVETMGAYMSGSSPGVPDPEEGPLPELALPTVAAVAPAARQARLLERAANLAEWVGSERPLTARGMLKRADTAAVITELKLLPTPPSTMPRSARDVMALHRLWEVAQDQGWLRVSRAGSPKAMGSRPSPPADDNESLSRWVAALHLLLDPDSETIAHTDLPWDEVLPGVLASLYVAHADQKGLRVEELSQMAIQALSGLPWQVAPSGIAADARTYIEATLEVLTDLAAVEVHDGTATLTPLGAFGLRDWLEAEGYDAPVTEP